MSCVLFGHHYGQTDTVKLYKEPSTKWNGGPQRWKEHHNSKATSMHQSSDQACQVLVSQMEGKDKKIDDILDSVMRERIAKNREKIKPMLTTVVFCARQNLPLRGHSDNVTDHQTSSNNTGIFLALLDFCIQLGDTVLQNHFDTASKNATCVSPMIQNEIIWACKKYIQGKLLSEIRGRFFSITGDDASDCSNKEQLSLCLRFIDEKGEI